MKGYGRTGFLSYLETGEFTPDFISDVDRLIKKIYNRWRLYEDLSEFHAFCWAKIVRSMRIYEEQNGRERGPVSTYLYQVIMNEARRLHSKFKRVTCDDAEDVLDQGLSASDSSGFHEDFDLRDRLRSFAIRAYHLGVFVDQEFLLKNYCGGISSPGVKAFTWTAILGI
jgi:hypothetical protein